MNEEFKTEVLRDWPNAVFVSREDWLNCLVYQDDTRSLYESWLDDNPAAVLYIIRCDGRYSMGARYGLEKGEYLSPYGDQNVLKALQRQRRR